MWRPVRASTTSACERVRLYAEHEARQHGSPSPGQLWLFDQKPVATGEPMQLSAEANCSTKTPTAEIDELADDIGQHGILQPIVVGAADRNRSGGAKAHGCLVCGNTVANLPVKLPAKEGHLVSAAHRSGNLRRARNDWTGATLVPLLRETPWTYGVRLPSRPISSAHTNPNSAPT
jgi:hypothetical protein